MDTVTYGIVVVTIIANLAIAAADLLRARFVLANSAAVGVGASWLPVLAAAKAAGAVGLIAGLAGMTPIGVLAALGLVGFFTGALVAHIRARVFDTLAYPLAYFLLAVGSLVHMLMA